MALYETLPVYKLTYDLLREVHEMNMDPQREQRFAWVENLREGLVDIVVCIYKANVNEVEKEGNIRKARERLVEVRLYVRLLYDLHPISIPGFSLFWDKIEELSKQLGAWHKSIRR